MMHKPDEKKRENEVLQIPFPYSHLEGIERNSGGFTAVCPACNGRLAVEMSKTSLKAYCGGSCSESAVTDALAELITAGAGAHELGMTPPAVKGMTLEYVTEEDILDNARNGELGAATIFALSAPNAVRYDFSEKSYFLWNGNAWAKVLSGVTLLISDVVTRQLKRALSQLNDDKKRFLQYGGDDKKEEKRIDNELKTVQRAIRSMGQASSLNNVASLLANLCPVDTNKWDMKPYLLPLKNGVIDLKTGDFSRGKPSDYLRHATDTEFDITAKAPAWAKFIADICKEDANAPRRELEEFLQRLLGYFCTGLAVEHKLFIFHGRGRNGKTVLSKVMAFILGDMAAEVDKSILLNSVDVAGGQASPHLYRLRGVRYGYLGETNEGKRLDAASVKNATGAGILTARPLYGLPVSFLPTHKLTLDTNHLPHASATDFALWERLIPIHLQREFVSNPDKSNPKQAQSNDRIYEELIAESSGILNWLIAGAVSYNKVGLNIPASIMKDRDGYRRAEDTIADFIEEACIVEEVASIKKTELYSLYTEYARDSSIKPMRKSTFYGRIEGKGFYIRKTNKYDVFDGLRSKLMIDL